MTETIKTKEYNIFKKNHLNRDLDESNVKRIERSLKISNLLELRPIVVNDRMEIIDGQHRLEAAKRLHLDVWYTIARDLEGPEMVLLNTNQQRWLLADYLNYYCKQGMPDYLKVREFLKNTDMSLSTIVRTCSMGTQSRQTAFQSGKLSFSDEKAERLRILYEEAFDILQMIEVKGDKATTPKGTNFNNALMSFLALKGVISSIFKQKILFRMDSLRPCTSRASYVRLFQSIYNWKNSEPVNVDTEESYRTF